MIKTDPHDHNHPLVGQIVVYSDGHRPPEQGTVTSVCRSQQTVAVLFSGSTSASCPVARLTHLDGGPVAPTCPFCGELHIGHLPCMQCGEPDV